MQVKYSEIASNFRVVEIETKNKEFLRLFFSYETLVGFIRNGKIYCIENQWGPATGKHLNQIESDKKKRLSKHDFNLACDNYIGVI